jgi:hypothetical protein
MSLQITINGKNILCTALEWNGSKETPARQVIATIPISRYDKNVPFPSVKEGDLLKLLDGKTELFRGVIFSRTLTNTELVVTANDSLVYLMKNQTSVNFKTTTITKVMGFIARETGVRIGTYAAANTSITLKPEIGITYYTLLLKAYNEASKKTGKKYFPFMIEGKLYVLEKGKEVGGFVAEASENITESEFTSTIENMVNRVMIVDDKGKRLGYVENAGDRKKYGTLQEVYQKEDKKNANNEAKKLLKGIEKEGRITIVPGNTKCISGRSLVVKNQFGSLAGKFYIDADTHAWQNGVYTTTLTLSFSNTMDEVEV